MLVIAKLQPTCSRPTSKNTQLPSLRKRGNQLWSSSWWVRSKRGHRVNWAPSRSTLTLLRGRIRASKDCLTIAKQVWRVASWCHRRIKVRWKWRHQPSSQSKIKKDERDYSKINLISLKIISPVNSARVGNWPYQLPNLWGCVIGAVWWLTSFTWASVGKLGLITHLDGVLEVRNRNGDIKLILLLLGGLLEHQLIQVTVILPLNCLKFLSVVTRYRLCQLFWFLGFCHSNFPSLKMLGLLLQTFVGRCVGCRTTPLQLIDWELGCILF